MGRRPIDAGTYVKRDATTVTVGPEANAFSRASSIGIMERDGPYGPVPGETLVGPSASLSVPIFNQGASSIARGQATSDMLTADVQSLELTIDNDIASRVAALESAREVVILYWERLVPVQRTIVEESQKQRNYMLIGTFELLAAKQLPFPMVRRSRSTRKVSKRTSPTFGPFRRCSKAGIRF
jgi:Outer membrane efflux protein